MTRVLATTLHGRVAVKALHASIGMRQQSGPTLINDSSRGDSSSDSNFKKFRVEESYSKLKQQPCCCCELVVVPVIACPFVYMHSQRVWLSSLTV